MIQITYEDIGNPLYNKKGLITISYIYIRVHLTNIMLELHVKVLNEDGDMMDLAIINVNIFIMQYKNMDLIILSILLSE